MGSHHCGYAVSRSRPELFALVLLMTVVATAAGCASAGTSSRIADSFVAAAPGCGLDRESKLVLSRTSMAFVRALAGLAGDDMDEDAREILNGVRRVEVVSYRIEPECDFRERAIVVPKRLTDQGWRAAMFTVEGAGESSWVLTREGPDGDISGMLVISLDHHGLEVVRLDGNIDRVLVAATVDEPSTVRGLFDGDV